MKSLFIFDVESIGLHGEAFAVAGGIYLANGAVQEEFSFACPLEEATGHPDDRKWVKENIPVLAVTHLTTRGVRAAFWQQWKRSKEAGCVMVADCGWPVEANFLRACVNDDPEARKWEGPYPLHEAASFLSAVGIDPMAKHPRTESEKPEHDPLADSRQSARLICEALTKLNLWH